MVFPLINPFHTSIDRRQPYSYNNNNMPLTVKTSTPFICRSVGDRAHVIERQVNAKTGEKAQNQEFINLDECMFTSSLFLCPISFAVLPPPPYVHLSLLYWLLSQLLSLSPSPSSSPWTHSFPPLSLSLSLSPRIVFVVATLSLALLYLTTLWATAVLIYLSWTFIVLPSYCFAPILAEADEFGVEWKGKTHTLNHSSSLLHPSLGHSHRNHLAESRGLPSTSRPRSPGNRKFVRGNCQRKKTLLCMHQMAAIATLGPSTPPTPRAIKTDIVTKYCRKPTVPLCI